MKFYQHSSDFLVTTIVHMVSISFITFPFSSQLSIPWQWSHTRLPSPPDHQVASQSLPQIALIPKFIEFPSPLIIELSSPQLQFPLFLPSHLLDLQFFHSQPNLTNFPLHFHSGLHSPPLRIALALLLTIAFTSIYSKLHSCTFPWNCICQVM